MIMRVGGQLIESNLDPTNPDRTRERPGPKVSGPSPFANKSPAMMQSRKPADQAPCRRPLQSMRGWARPRDVSQCNLQLQGPKGSKNGQHGAVHENLTKRSPRSACWRATDRIQP